MVGVEFWPRSLDSLRSCVSTPPPNSDLLSIFLFGSWKFFITLGLLTAQRV